MAGGEAEPWLGSRMGIPQPSRQAKDSEHSCQGLGRVPTGDRNGKGAVHGMRRGLHDLMRRAGAAGIVTRALTGHVSSGMTEHYSTVGFDEKRAAVAGVVGLVSLPKTVDRTVDGGRN